MMSETATTPKYGPASFLAAIVNILLVNFAALMFVLWAFWGYQYYLPFFVTDLLVSVLLVYRSGLWGQVGRGMLIGWLSVPVSLVVFIAAFSAGKAIGL